jgi:hypothetical protein
MRRPRQPRVEDVALAGSCRLLEKLPEDLRNRPEATLLGAAGDRKVYNIIHLIYRAKNYEGHSKDYEFSRLSMEEHRRGGYYDARRTLRHPEVVKRPTNHADYRLSILSPTYANNSGSPTSSIKPLQAAHRRTRYGGTS